MRGWLAAFVVLFAAVELFEWIAQLGSWQPNSLWLLLGGMGLAALSNAAHWPKATDTAEVAMDESVADSKCQPKAVAETNHAVVEVSAKPGSQAESLADKSAGDSISFKVRPLKR